MSTFLIGGGRSAATQRQSHQQTNSPNLSPTRRSSSLVLERQRSVSPHGRRRALDLYGTREIVYTHEQLKKNTVRQSRYD